MPKAVGRVPSMPERSRPHHPAARRPGRAPGCAADDRGRADRGGRRRGRRRRARARARRRQQPRRRRRGLPRHGRARSRPAGSAPTSTTTSTPPAAGATVTVAAGETWDALVALAVERGWVGVEALSGIPGHVGATPIQNVGAYGQEVARPSPRVRVWDRSSRGVAHLRRRRLRLRLPHQPVQAGPRPLRRPRRHLPAAASATSAPRCAYAELARTLGVEVGERAPLDDGARGRARPAHAARAWCSTRPTTTPGAPARSSPTRSSRPPRLPDGRPGLAAARRHRQDQRGLADRARRVRQGLRRTTRCRLSTKHTLALTNRGRATTDDLLALAREVRDGVTRRTSASSSSTSRSLVGCAL